MKYTTVTSIAMLFCKFHQFLDQGCGGLLEGDSGRFRYSPHAAAAEKNPPTCVWLVQAYGATQIQLTLDEFQPRGDNNAVIFYSNTASGETDLNPIPLKTQAVGSTLNIPGSIVIVILPQSSLSLSFTWDSILPVGFNPNDITTLADYIEVPEGELIWTPARRREQLWWIIGARASADDAVIEWKTQADLSDCDRNHPCSCLSFEAFELSTDGYLLGVARTCGRTCNGVFQMKSNLLVVAVSANTTKRGASKVELRWVGSQGTSSATSSSTTASPGDQISVS